MDFIFFSDGAGLQHNVFIFNFRSVERLDPREAHWTAISPMNRKRGILSAASLGGKMYNFLVFGICNGSVYHKTYHNSFLVLVIICNAFLPCSYAIGGYDGSECLSSVEVYEPRTNSWVEMVR